jgi:hypothetical protein
MTPTPAPRPTAGTGHQTTSAAEFDSIFSSEADVMAFNDVVRQVDPALPDGIEPFSFLCSYLLEHVLNHLDLYPHQVLADLGDVEDRACGSPAVQPPQTANSQNYPRVMSAL